MFSVKTDGTECENDKAKQFPEFFLLLRNVVRIHFYTACTVFRFDETASRKKKTEMTTRKLNRTIVICTLPTYSYRNDFVI